MRLNFSRVSRAEDRIEAWITRHYQERVLAGETVPWGPCPDDLFLNELARKSRRIALSDPRVDHAATCPKCMRRLIEIRQAIRSHRSRSLATVSIVSSLAFIILCLIAVHNRSHRHIESATVVAQTVNLWNDGVVRGIPEDNPESISLPAAKIKLTVILPAFSSPGKYVIAIVRSQNGEGIIAQGQSLTEAVKNEQRVHVELNLSGVRAGKYFLSTTCEQEQASYYYPLEIK